MDNSSAPWDKAFEEQVRRYLLKLPRTQPLAPDLSLRANGLDSYTLFSLLAGIENLYGLRFPADLLTFDTFDTPAMLWEALQKAKTALRASDKNVGS